MKTTRLGRRIEQGLGALLLLAALAIHPALAHASPPDPSWIPGIYDGADFDDVVLLVASGYPAAAPAAIEAPSPDLPLIGQPAHGPEAVPAAPTGGLLRSRAPPAR
ncbi:MAG TPA: hypothetical protein VFX14_18725 [Methylomirabilota bacterium]|nr:hypothetical protein [Methylomirabilota bacterium]